MLRIQSKDFQYSQGYKIIDYFYLMDDSGYTFRILLMIEASLREEASVEEGVEGKEPQEGKNLLNKIIIYLYLFPHLHALATRSVYEVR